jgi:hypothetical protein
VFLLNSWLNHFTETPREAGYALSRSYSVNLPSSFSTAHPSALGYSPRLPVSVCGTGRFSLALEVFLGGMIRTTIHAAEALWYYHVRHPVRIYRYKIYLHALRWNSVSTRVFHYRVTPSKLKRVLEY